MSDLDPSHCWQLCEEKTTVSEEMFLSMIAKAKEDLKTRQKQMALQEEEKKKRLVRVESTLDVSRTFNNHLTVL